MMHTSAWGGYGDEADGEIFSAYEDGDSPPYVGVTYVQRDGLRISFILATDTALEFLVASIRNGQTRSRAGQVWRMIRKNLYIVNYSVCKSGKLDSLNGAYGYRRAYSNKKAREYFYDES